MTCWRCGRVDHTEWCSDGTPSDCTHCGGNPCRWWCMESMRVVLNVDMPPSSNSVAYHRERFRRIQTGEWVFA